MRSIEEVADDIGFKMEDEWHDLIDKQTSRLNDLKARLRDEKREARQAIARGIETQPRRKKRKKSSGLLGLAWLGRKISGASHYESYSYEVEILNTNEIRDTIDDAKDWLEDELQPFTEAMFNHNFVKKGLGTTDSNRQ